MTTTSETRQIDYMVEANEIMANYPEVDSFKDRRPIVIYYAAHQKCQACGAGIDQPCISLSISVNKRGRENRWPHSVRIDWKLMVEGLRKKGYHRSGEEEKEEER